MAIFSDRAGVIEVENPPRFGQKATKSGRNHGGQLSGQCGQDNSVDRTIRFKKENPDF